MADREVSGRINFEGEAAEEVERLNEQMDESLSTLSELETESEAAGATVEAAGAEGAESMEDLAQETEGASDAMGEAEGAAEGFGGAIGALGVVAATAGIVAFGKASIDAAVSLEEQQFRVRALSGDAFPELKAAIDQTIISQKGLRAEGDLSEAVNEALKLGVAGDVIAASLENTATISSVLGIELPRVMKSIGLAIETGTSSQLERMGLLSEETFVKLGFGAETSLASLSKTERELVVLTAVQDKANEVAGSFAEFTETSAGQLAKFDTQIGNVMEIIGGVFLPIMNAILEPLSEFALFLQENEEALLAFEIAVGVVAAVIGVLLVGALIAAIPPAISFAVAMLSAAAVPLAIAAGIAILVLIVDDLITFFQGGESAIGDFIDQFPLLSIPLQIIIAEIELLIDILDFLFDKFLEFIDFVTPFAEIIGDIFGAAFGGLQSIVETGLSFIPDFFPGSPVKKGPLMVLNDAGSNIIDLVQGGIQEAPPLDIAGGAGGLGGGGAGGVNIGRVEFVFNIKAPEGRFGTKDVIVSQVNEALDELARGRLRGQLGLSS